MLLRPAAQILIELKILRDELIAPPFQHPVKISKWESVAPVGPFPASSCKYTEGMGALPVAKLSVEEYLALDRAAEVPSEYHDGEMFQIEAVTVAHGILSVNLGRRLAEQLAGTPCRVVGSSVRVRATPTKYLLPDMIVVCGKVEVTDEHQDTLTNPKVIVEILSRSTAGYDYSEKFALYRRIESFEEYILVAQDQPRVEIFRKTPDKRWLLSTYEGLDAVAEVGSLSISFRLGEVYDGVELPEAQPD
jgi:Uma2 family endonuclease